MGQVRVPETRSPRCAPQRTIWAFAGLGILFAAMLPVSGRAQSATAAPATQAGHVEASSLPDAPLPVIASAVAESASSSSDEADAQEIHPRLSLQPATQQTSGQPQQQPAQQPGSQQNQAPSLSDLGLASTKPDPDMQARLDRHTEMLKIHQRMGLITLVPLAAACISSAAAPPDPRNGSGNTVGRDIHLSLGAASVAMYAVTASYAIRAPRIPGEAARGGIKWHKYLIYVHAPGMVLTPILGAMAFNQANNGEKVHGIASAHAAVAWTTVASYSAAIVAVSWPLHVKY